MKTEKVNKTRKERRTFKEIRDKILLSLGISKKTINQIAEEIGVNWKSVDNHLTYLLGKGMVELVFESDYTRVFDLSDKGREYVNLLKEINSKLINPKLKIRSENND